MKNQTILITGASGGIGRACALNLSRKGIRVILHYNKNHSAINSLANEIKEYSNNYDIINFDLTNKQETLKAVENIDLDGFVHTAAINHPGLFLALEDGNIEMPIIANLINTMLLTKVILKKLLSKKKGNIIFISSTVTKKLHQGQAVYAASKAGIESFAKAIAKEYSRKGIRVNIVSPGPIDTAMLKPTLIFAEADIKKNIPINRIGEADEVAELVSFLLSDKANYITGANYLIDGGFSLG